jgi:hypothetical protein
MRSVGLLCDVSKSPSIWRKILSARGIIIGTVLTFHLVLVGWQGVYDGPGWDEIGHLAAGIDHWRHWRFELFSVNPPLVRLVATLPVAISEGIWDPAQFATPHGPGIRPEFAVGTNFADVAGPSYFTYLTIAREMCLLFCVLGAWVCYKWASELWGQIAGILALTLWCFSPTVLAYGHLITPDLGAAATGVVALYVFRRWLICPTTRRLIAAGVTLGLAELSKTTWLILIPLYPVLWLMWRALTPASGARQEAMVRSQDNARGIAGQKSVRLIWREGRHVLGMLLMAWAMLNLAYGFEGTFKRLDEFELISAPMGGHVVIDGPPSPGNRFTGTWLGKVPVPVPENYLVGIDYMKWEFEHKVWSYLDGEWKLGGWWYYYVFCLLYKEPLGTWVLFMLAIGTTIFWRRKFGASLREELFVLVPCFVVFAFVSAQTGINLHIRYALPAFPLLFVWISKVGQLLPSSLKMMRFQPPSARAVVAMCVMLAVGWSITNSLSVFPHHMSYFNELAGGPYNGYKHLSETNLDWGQDLHYAKVWYDQHPEARPFHFESDVTAIKPKNVGFEAGLVPWDLRSKEAETLVDPKPSDIGPVPGWYCVSIKHIQTNRSRTFDYLKELTPVEWIGYTLPVYHVSLEQAAALRRRYGLPELAGPHDSQAAAPDGGGK